jgi:hypothetical protein
MVASLDAPAPVTRMAEQWRTMRPLLEGWQSGGSRRHRHTTAGAGSRRQTCPHAHTEHRLRRVRHQGLSADNITSDRVRYRVAYGPGRL